ncbi:MAG TPA: PD-(D/E)XK nuclease family protein [Burkholderiales bacterium]|nr:PD-(D/E)XK nuclease family protein [Burkholderiales bacterium]
MISQHELFVRLAEGHAAGITVVTPNARLARALVAGFDEFQSRRDLASWEAADILPLGAFVERLWEDALYNPAGETGGEALPLLLTPAQEQHLWEAILAESGLLAVPEAAAHCREAWRLAHQWRIGAAHGNEDAAAFAEWSREYEHRTRGDTDAARLPDLVSGCLDRVKKPRLLVACGFDVVPPQTSAFLARFATETCSLERIAARASKAAFPSARHELEAAAKWARARLEEGRARVGVVVPELQKRRSEVVRIFSRTLQPGGNLPAFSAQSSKATAMPFNVSLGLPLAAWPLVDAALALLALSHGELDFPAVSQLVRSPFLGGGESEVSRRAILDARLRRDADPALSLGKLIALLDKASLLRSRLEKAFEIAKSRPDTPGEWARHFSALLDAAGFPGERALDSAEFQTRAKLHEALGELAKLERVTTRFSFVQAISFLSRHCARTLFQPESADAPIQVLGLLESRGLRFDCLWVSGLTDEAWPLSATPNPFLPIGAQKAAGIPEASAEASLELDRRITAEWRGAAGEVVFSYPLKEKDHDLAPSPLIAEVPEESVPVPEFPRYRDLLFDSRKTQSFADWKAPLVAEKKMRGGTRVLADQAACPFRAFARWRLGADALEEPAPGPDARERGKLLHVLMKEIWGELRGSEALESDCSKAIARAAAVAAKELGLEERFAGLERERLAKLAREWLEVESRREPFEVSSLEEKRTLTVAGLELQSRIDRMDRLRAGGHVLIDYKTGNVGNPRQWHGPRPDDPQLPLYAVAAPEELAAVVFAKLKAGEMRFMGYSRAPNLIPNVGVNPVAPWPKLLEEWRRDTAALAEAFTRGEAGVDPKEGLKTCRLCDLQTLCRVYEKFAGFSEGEDEPTPRPESL